MKKQYLISLLGLAALSISFGNGFSSMPSSSTNNVASEEATSATSNFSEEELNTLEEYENEFPEYSIEQVDMGVDHSAAVVNDGSGPTGDHLYTWGYNDYGQLGLGTGGEEWDEENTPQEVTYFQEQDIEQISIDIRGSSFAIVEGDLYAWGFNDNGRLVLGDEFEEQYYNTPQLVTYFEDKDVEQISSQTENAAAVADGDLYTWGLAGCCGVVNPESIRYYDTPQLVPDFEGQKIEQISLGGSHSGAIVDGQLYTWGGNWHGELGLGTGGSLGDIAWTPQLVTTFEGQNVEQVSMGDYHSSALVDGELYTWGGNSFGQLGLGDRDDYLENDGNSEIMNIPYKVDLPDGNIEQISADGYSSSAIVDGDLYTWGYNHFGQLGLGNNKNYSTPQLVTDFEDKDVEQITMGWSDNSAIVDGGLYTWGSNSGLLGLGDEFSNYYYDTPQEVWSTPYLNTDSIYSSATLDVEDLDKITIEYGFETNVEVEDVTIVLEDNNSSTDFEIPNVEVTDKPTLEMDSNEYKGQIIIDDEALVPGADYIYTINLNYLNYYNEEKTIQLDQQEIANNVAPKDPSLVEMNTKNTETNATDAIEVDFDLDLGHDQSNTPYTLEEIIFDDYSNDEQYIYTENGDSIDNEIVDGQFESYDSETGKGSVVVTNLIPDTDYNWDVTFILSSPWEENNIEIKDELDEFTTLSAYEQSSIKNDGRVVTSSTSASVDYKIELGKNSHGQTAEIEKVEWKTKNHKTLARTYSSDVTSDVTGTLKATGLTTNTFYNDTYIVATMKDGTKTDKDKINLFKTKSLAEKSTLTANLIYEDITSTSASANYEVIPGKNANGKPEHVDNVKWIDGDGDTVLASSKFSAVGTLTADDLNPYTTYSGTYIVATMIDGKTSNKIPFGDFDTASEQELSTISADPVEVISSTKASVDYNIILGVDDYGEGVTISNVQWINDGNVLVSSTSKELDGTLTAKHLSPNTIYSNTILVATMSDGTSTDAITLDPFTTDSGAKQSTITVEAPQPTSITGASVAYKVNPGKDADANDIFAINVQWMNVTQDGTQELASSRRGATTLTTDKLEPDQLYDETYLIATMSDGSKTEKTDVDPFLTWTNAEESTIIASDVEVISPTEARIAYSVTPGLDTYGNDISVEEVKWMDGDERLASSNKANGVLTTDRLESNQEYNDTFLIAYMSDKTTATIDVNNFNDKNVTPEVDQLHHVQVDYDDDILDVKGSIDTNGAAINDIYFVKDGQRIHTDYLEGEFNQASNSDNVTYDMWTKEYLGEKNLDGSADLEGYSIAIEYGNELFEESISLATTDDHSSIAEDQAIEKELGYLLEEEKTSFSAAAISLMAIGAILIIGLIGAGGFGGYYLYKRH